MNKPKKLIILGISVQTDYAQNNMSLDMMAEDGEPYFLVLNDKIIERINRGYKNKKGLFLKLNKKADTSVYKDITLTEKDISDEELLAFLKKHNITYPISLETLDQILNNLTPIKLDLVTEQKFMKTMRDVMEAKKEIEGMSDEEFLKELRNIDRQLTGNKGRNKEWMALFEGFPVEISFHSMVKEYRGDAMLLLYRGRKILEKLAKEKE